MPEFPTIASQMHTSMSSSMCVCVCVCELYIGMEETIDHVLFKYSWKLNKSPESRWLGISVLAWNREAILQFLKDSFHRRKWDQAQAKTVWESGWESFDHDIIRALFHALEGSLLAREICTWFQFCRYCNLFGSLHLGVAIKVVGIKDFMTDGTLTIFIWLIATSFINIYKPRIYCHLLLMDI